MQVREEESVRDRDKEDKQIIFQCEVLIYNDTFDIQSTHKKFR